MSQEFKYDVFLSHSSKDKVVVRELAERLKQDGLRVWFGDWEMRPGDMITKKIEEGLDKSRILVLCMSRNTFGSEWAALESATFRFRDLVNQERRFIPLRLDDTPFLGSVQQFAYVDWRTKDEAGYALLLQACKTEPSGLAKETPQATAVSHESAILLGFKSPVTGVAVSPDGKRLLSCSVTGQLQVLNLSGWERTSIETGHVGAIWGLTISPDGRLAATCSIDKTIRIWDLGTLTLFKTISSPQRTLWSVCMTPDCQRIISASADGSIAVFDLNTGTQIALLTGHDGPVYSVAVSSDGNLAVSASKDATLRLWNLREAKCEAILQGHGKAVRAVAFSRDNQRIISGGAEGAIRIWNLQGRFLEASLEGHTRGIRALTITPDGARLISGSQDGTCKVWTLATGECVADLRGHKAGVSCVFASPNNWQVYSGGRDRVVRVWDLSKIGAPESSPYQINRYTNAKVILAGDSGVGKSGLALRLSEHRFTPTISTDGAWATQLKLPHATAQAGIEREIWLWDFAGQPDRRLIHQLYMDEVSLALIVFDPQSENPFEGLGQWDRDLQRAARRPFAKLLVAGRCDRGGLMVSRESIEQFRKERGFVDYIETSALQDAGCDSLRNAIIGYIPWETIPWTASPRIFRTLKDEIVRLKDEGNVLLRMAELKQQLQLRLPAESFTLEQLRAVVGLLAGPGVVWQLEFGDFVLLQPERINAYATAVIRAVRAHTEEIGCIPEENVLTGKLDYQDMKRLPLEDEQIILRAMHQMFVNHGLCLREHTDKGALLIFPSYFKRERPELKGHPLVLVTYQFSGPLDEIYATLVVRLHHTAAFERDRLWRYAADFKTPGSKRLGLKMTRKTEGAAELELYFEPGIANDVQVTFIRYVHEHLKLKAQEVVRLRHYACPHCGAGVENRRAIEERLKKGLKDIVCVSCEKRVPLWDLIEQKFASAEFQNRVRELEEHAKLAIDNESRELVLIGHAFAIAGEAGQIFRPTPNSDWGIDGEIEFKDDLGKASGQRLYLQLKSGDSYLYHRKEDGAEIFTIKNERHADYWQQQAYPVMLVIRTSDGTIRWMDVSDYLKRESKVGKKAKQVVFSGEPLTALNLRRMRERFVCLPK